MYFIDKRADLPEAYGAWLEANAELLQAQYDSDIKGSEMWKEHTEKEDFPKGELRRALLEDQGFICCYCGYPILNDGMTCAIEHFKPKADYKSLVFEYSNLFASCRGGCKDIVHMVKHEDTLESIAGQYSLPNNYLVEINGDLDNLDGVRRIVLKSLVNKKEQHCDICKGRKKLSKVNFLDDTSFSAIYYSTDGEILSEDTDFEKDIDILGLNNNPELNFLRHMHYERALELYRAVKMLGDEVPIKLLTALREKYSQKDKGTLRFKPFYFIYLWVWKN